MFTVFSFEGIRMAWWLSWLERRPVTAEVVGSNPTTHPKLNIWHLYADVAQLAEQLICNQQVIGSSPIIGFYQFNIDIWVDSRVAKGDRL